MSQIIQVSGVGPVEFPDDTPDAEIKAALDKEFGDKAQPKSSALGAAGRGFLGGLAPTGAAVAAGEGTALGLELLGAPETLGTTLLAIPPTVAAGYLAGKLQQKAVHKYAPRVEEQQQADIQQHPIASAAGEVASGAPFMRLQPGAILRNPKSAVI